MFKLKYAFAACALMTAPLAAEETASEANIKIAEDYLAAYSTFEVDAMAPFMAEDVIFSDPTSSEQSASGGAFMFKGKAAALKGLGDYAAQYNSFTVDYDLERRYESNGVVVFIGMLNYQLVTKDDRPISGAAPIVTAITLKDGKVAQHLDLYDYSGNVVEFD